MALGVVVALTHIRDGYPFIHSPAGPSGLLGYELINQPINSITDTNILNFDKYSMRDSGVAIEHGSERGRQRRR